MGVKVGILLIAILAGCFADPLPNPGFVDSDFFYNVDAGSRIVGGNPAAEGSVPYMVAITQGNIVRSFVCGASLLSQRSILTAAHCIDAVYSWGSLLNSLRVTVGTNRWATGGQTYTIARNVTHQHYISQTIKNDIGLLITTNNVIFSDVVVPVILSYDFVGPDVSVRANGWGRIRFQGPGSPELLTLTLSTIDGERCSKEVAEAGIIHNMAVPHIEDHIELCVVHSVDHGMCHGDSGSALVRVDNGQQVGVVSWGVPCARGAPDMFARVSAFRDWILENLV
ncbi:trypsin domain-containing protein [Phthorimaea operculella]|nr:trypsin domain-containing protein [Phthorimaea operculella]